LRFVVYILSPDAPPQQINIRDFVVMGFLMRGQTQLIGVVVFVILIGVGTYLAMSTGSRHVRSVSVEGNAVSSAAPVRAEGNVQSSHPHVHVVVVSERNSQRTSAGATIEPNGGAQTSSTFDVSGIIPDANSTADANAGAEITSALSGIQSDLNELQTLLDENGD